MAGMAEVAVGHKANASAPSAPPWRWRYSCPPLPRRLIGLPRRGALGRRFGAGQRCRAMGRRAR